MILLVECQTWACTAQELGGMVIVAIVICFLAWLWLRN